MASRWRHRGTGLILAVLVLLFATGALFALTLGARAALAQRERATDRALAQAREALLAYAAERPINATVGPGYLPCPDLDNDGWAESTCGSLSGDTGQAERLGRLPWKTLGLADLRDGHGERLWYAVSSKQKGLLNCAASPACLDMTPAATLGTISVRDASGTLIHDGTLASLAQADAGGAVAVVIAPGPPLVRIASADADGGIEQVRDCAPGDCDALGRCIAAPPQRAATCDPRNYLDRAPGARFADEDNAAFVDRNDAAGRARNRDGFIHGPVMLADGRLAVNDRVAAITYRSLTRRVMRRVALEAAQCLRFYASRPENAGRYPAPLAACGRGERFGTVPDTPFGTTLAASGARMLGRWWRTAPRDPENLAELPTRDDACRIAIAPEDAGPWRSSPAGSSADEARTAGLAEHSWWSTWKPHAFYALARGYEPSSSGAGACVPGDSCLQLASGDGAVVAEDKQFAVIVSATCPDSTTCVGAACERIALGQRTAGIDNGVAAFP